MKVSLVTMSQGNPVVLKKTFQSFWGVVDEIVFGDLTIFEDDAKLIESYKDEFNLKIIKYPFTYIFNSGFSSLLNSLISHAKNDVCIYMNCSEVIELGKDKIAETLDLNSGCNTFYFDHGQDPHRWHRLADRRSLNWSGLLHEELSPYDNYIPYHRALFRMQDLPKDNENPFKSRCYDFCKECVYFTLYKKIVDNPELLGNTSEGWIRFATENYQSFTERLESKGDFYRAFLENDINLLYKYVNDNPEFKKERLISSTLIEYQNSPMFLGKE